MMNTREALYQNFPRMVGDPTQRPVESMAELNRFAIVTSGNNDKCFSSCCSYLGNQPVFEDLFLEIDMMKIEPIQKVGKWFDSHGIPWIVLDSGSRGFHIHGLFEPEIVSQKTVKKFADLIIKETETLDDFDPHVTGDLKRLCRIPETQRLNGRWCTSVTSEEIFSEDIQSIRSKTAVPRYIDHKIGKRPKITEFIQDSEPEPIESTITQAAHKEIFFLKDVVRPCVYNLIHKPNPTHTVRIDLVIEMLNHGINSTKILDIIENLNWIDYERSYTKYQIDFIENKRKEGKYMIPYGKKILGCQKRGSCFLCILREN